MDFFTVRQRTLTTEDDNGVYEGFYDELKKAIFDECGFNSAQVKFVLNQASERPWSHAQHYVENVRTLSYTIRNFLNIE